MKININLPNHQINDWRVKNFSISVNQSRASARRAMFDSSKRGYIEPGDYVSLNYKGEIVMSNSTDEIKDHVNFIKEAKGNILITGLGLGVCIHGLIQQGKYEKITVLEKNKEVIQLCGEQFTKYENIEIIHADAFTYEIPPNIRYDYVWHDIWYEICGSNYPSIQSLKKKYKAHAGWQGAWCEKLMRKRHRELD